MGATGISVIDFGTIPGTNYVTASVLGQSGIVSGSVAEAFFMDEATPDHNAYEHLIVPIKLACASVVPSVGFTIIASTEVRLTGKFAVHWVWV